MAYIAEEVEEREEEEEVGDRMEEQQEEGMLLRQEMRTVKEDEFESEVSAKSDYNN